ncbi:cyclin-dependent kinase inhibitor 5-like [Alnus glutinosa]|uniref:cyclin-dependent kinase inhibitor 5-like n=1 Tax=Alnus glutinosa TaxID=3517 RepID=UPI002D771E1B|nr:cyclin-dependent kinase inhibitor 5-like [Alnus glutinosa]
MGKYIRKAKATGELAVMEVSQSSLGVRTRARTLALQKSPAPSSPAAASGSYLQLRSRRLEKPPVALSSQDSGAKRHKQAGSNPRAGSSLRVGSHGPKVVDQEAEEVEKEEDLKEKEKSGNNDLAVEEASFGENVLEFEGRERSTRESTPCSLIRDPDTIRTPGSSTRPTCSTETNRRTQNTMRRHIPTAQEMDEFFAAAEEDQQRQFIEKYNFDPVNDKPLPGRYEWEKLDP